MCYLIAVVMFGLGFRAAFSAPGVGHESLGYGWAAAVVVIVFMVVVGAVMILESHHRDVKSMDLVKSFDPAKSVGLIMSLDLVKSVEL